MIMVYERQREDWMEGIPTAGWNGPQSQPNFWSNYEYLCRISAKGVRELFCIIYVIYREERKVLKFQNF